MADTPQQKKPKPKSPIKNNRAKQIGRSPQSSKATKLPASECRSYAELRIALDSFQAMALVYYAAGKSQKERDHRAAKIKRVVKNTLKQWKQPSPKLLAPKLSAPAVQAAFMTIGGYGNGCDPGYCDCNGFCIPQGQPCY